MVVQIILVGVISCLIAYLIGNIPFSVYVAKLAGHDLYSTGSKNPGASNVARIAGWKWGIVAMALDILKGFIPTITTLVILGHYFSQQNTYILAYLVAGSAILGHVIPIGRKGGKGIATGAGGALALFPLTGIVMVAIWFAMMKITKLPVISSIIAAGVLPIWMFIDHNYMWEFFVAMGLFAFVVIRHAPNLLRLIKSEESGVTKQGRDQYKVKD